MVLSGANTTTVVRNEDKTPHLTSEVPSIAASSGDFPRRRCVMTFSAITIASSIKRPSANRSATIVIMLIE